jgi:WD40 repeat protein
LWDVATGKEKATYFSHRGSIEGIMFSPDGKNLATRDYKGILKIWDTDKLKLH